MREVNKAGQTLMSGMEVLCPSAVAPSGSGAAVGMGGRRSSASSSPEFEFWMVRNPSVPQPDLLSADELFVDGVILPLRLRHQPSSRMPNPPTGPKRMPERVPQPKEEPRADGEAEMRREPRPPPPASATAAEPAAPVPLSSSSSSFSSCAAPSSSAQLSSSAVPSSSTSKRWKDLFRVTGGEKRAEDKERRRERKSSAGGGAELNINLWPFSRSRSAGNSGTRPKSTAASGRRVSSAPCSRSNSQGESSRAQTATVTSATAAAAFASNGTRRWASSPGRPGSGGIPVGRASPVWQARRGAKKGHYKGGDSNVAGMGSGGGGLKGVWGGGGGVRVNLKVNACVGYGQPLSCRTEDKDSVGGGGGSRTASATGSSNGSNGNHFISLRSFFSKKVH